MRDLPASEVAKRRIGLAARRLGTKNPIPAISGLLDRSFSLPTGDPRYGRNHLTPGQFPLEHSFSEIAGESLRLDMEPLGPQATPLARQQECGREVRRMAHAAYGRGAVRWFDQWSEPFRGAKLPGDARFGAWFGMGVDRHGLQEVKAYYELRPGELEGLPPNLQHAARVALSVLPDLEPIFTSIACGRQRGSQRLYFYNRGDLRLMDLEPLLHRLGIGDRLPSLLRAIGVALGGRFVLPEGSVILGLRDTQRGLELKIDVLVAGVPDPPGQMYGLLDLLLTERPRSQTAMRRVMQAYTTDEDNGPGHISVVSFRVRKDKPAMISVYLRPRGYDRQTGRSARGPGMPSDHGHTRSVHLHTPGRVPRDPYLPMH